MDRQGVMQRFLSKEMRGIEIGALYNPTVPKEDGWNVISVDHDTMEGLLVAYAGNPYVSAGSLQPVDVVWNHGLLSAALKNGGYAVGYFDYIVASHVIEHFPDLLGTLMDFEKILAEGGVLSLAVPDQRYCFDFFMPWSSTADLLMAYGEARSRHTKASFFRMAAYNAVGIVNHGHRDELVSAQDIGLQSDLHHAYARFCTHDESTDAGYVDNHTWYFTPSTFELVMLELRALGLLSLEVEMVERGPWGEFLVCMRKSSEPLPLTAEELNARRLGLLKQSVRELAHRAQMLDRGQQEAANVNDSLHAAQQERIAHLEAALSKVHKSTSWRVTWPIRALKSAWLRTKRS